MISSQEMISYLAATLTTASFLPQAILTIKNKRYRGPILKHVWPVYIGCFMLVNLWRTYWR